MSGRVDARFRAAALGLCGSLLLLAHPAFTAPAPRHVQPGKLPQQKPNPAPRALPRPDASPLPAVPPPGNEIMPISEVRPGMKGYGLTVFRGTKIERFDVEVVGVMPKANMDRPLVLVKLKGGPISERGAFLIQGMSGSPIYVNGKLLGAFSMGDAWPKEAQGMVTPIDDMLEALDPKLSEVPAGDTAFAAPEAPQGEIQAAAGAFKPLALPVVVSGLNGSRLARAAQILKPFNLNVMDGPGSMDKSFKADLTPGAAIGVALMSGDIDMTAIGTVTYRSGDKLVAFGHPMMQIGAAQFPITTAFIHDVFAGFQVSHKIGSAGEICGTLTQDRPFSIAAKVGPLPKMVPVTVAVDDKSTGRSKTFHVQTASHPLLVGQLVPVAVNQSIFTVRPVPGDAFARIKMKVETEGEGTITRDNVVFDASQVDVTAVRDLMELTSLLTSNQFHRVPIKSLDVQVTLEDRHPTASVERIFLSQDTVKPGDELEVGVVLRPYRKDPVVMRTKIKVPDSASNGRAVLMVQGGNTRVNLGALVAGGGGTGLPGAAPPDVSLHQIIKRFEDRERNDQLAVRILFPSTAVNINGERLSGLPSTLVDVMRSGKSTGFRIERDEARNLADTDYVVSGLQALQLTIQKDDHLEKPRTGTPGLGTPLGAPGGIGGQGGVTISAAAGGGDPDDLDYRVSRNTIPLTIDGKPHLLRLTPEEDEPEVDKNDKPIKKEEKKPDAKKPKKDDGARSKKGENPAVSILKPGDKPKDDEDEKPGVSADSTDNKLVGRQSKVWTQTTQADFERGTMSNAAVTTKGEVQLAPGLKLAQELDEQFVWSLVGANSSLYAGTGNGGIVMKVDGDKAVPFFRTGELEVHTLAHDAQGNLYAGTSPNGKIFKIAPDGKGTLLYSLNGDKPASEAGGKFVLALAVAENGTVYAGTGPGAKIYKLAPGAAPEQLADLKTESVTALSLGPDGKLYAGTGEDGAIYRVDPANGAAQIVYDTDQAVITGVAVDAQGNVFAAAAPSGAIYKIAPDGTPSIQFDKSRGALYDLKIDQTGNLYTCSANTVLRIEQDGTATLLSDRKNGQFTCLAWDDEGRLAAGSANTGSIFRLTPTLSGSFESTVHDAKLPSRWGRVRYTAVLPAGATLKVETRSGNTPEPDGTWSEWKAPETREGSLFVASPTSRFLQYRLLMQAERGAPGLRDISFFYLPKNQAPKLTLAAPTGGEIWRGSQTLKWAAQDPDGDTLTYEVSYSADGGHTWMPVGGETKAADQTLVPPAQAAQPTKASAEEALKKFREQLDKNPDLTPAQREENYQKAKVLVEKFFQENPPAPETPKATTPAPAPTTPAKVAGTTRNASITWNTAKIPDGIYVLRVTASDRASNASDALEDTKISEPFIVSNTPPQLFLPETGIAVGDKETTASGFASAKVALKGTQYRLDGGDWLAIDAEDGLWDSASERFRFAFPTPTAGQHEVEVKVVDLAGNVTSTRVKFKVP